MGPRRRTRRKSKRSISMSIEPSEDVTLGEELVEKKHRGGGTRRRSGTGKPVSANVENVVADFVRNASAIGVQGFRKEFAVLKSFIPENYKFEAFTANLSKNRYKDVVCLDSTRTVLTLDVPPETDYIHANWVKMESVDMVFIAAQAPMDNTISDFWRLCYQESVTTILMLCKIMEEGKKKCTNYWPSEAGSYNTYGTMFVNNKRVEKEDKFISYALEVLPEGCSNSLVVKLIHMMDWPDRGAPASGLTILRLLRLIEKPGPCLVHCSAGIGRTGTVIAIETVIQRLWKSIPVNMKDIIQEIRRQRASCIQTEAQFIFVISTVLDYIKAKMPSKYREKVLSFHADIKKANMI